MEIRWIHKGSGLTILQGYIYIISVKLSTEAQGQVVRPSLVVCAYTHTCSPGAICLTCGKMRMDYQGW